jgi:hypothetical protein
MSQAKCVSLWTKNQEGWLGLCLVVFSTEGMMLLTWYRIHVKIWEVVLI